MKNCKGLTFRQLKSFEGAPVYLKIYDNREGFGVLHWAPDGYLFVLQNFAKGSLVENHDRSFTHNVYLYSWIVMTPFDYKPDEPIIVFMHQTKELKLVDLNGD